MLLGAHLSIAGGLEQALVKVAEYGFGNVGCFASLLSPCLGWGDSLVCRPNVPLIVRAHGQSH